VNWLFFVVLIVTNTIVKKLQFEFTRKWFWKAL